MTSKIGPISGWLLICKNEETDRRKVEWYIAWTEPFGTKRAAIQFAKDNRWPMPYRAVRGELRVLP